MRIVLSKQASLRTVGRPSCLRWAWLCSACNHDAGLGVSQTNFVLESFSASRSRSRQDLPCDEAPRFVWCASMECGRLARASVPAAPHERSLAGKDILLAFGQDHSVCCDRSASCKILSFVLLERLRFQSENAVRSPHWVDS